MWKPLQGLGWLAGLALVAALAWRPALGIDLFWNGLIPAAPAVFVLATGTWRNLCPLATTAGLPQRLGLARPRPLAPGPRGWLNLGGVAALFALVPLRHLSFNADGPATAALLAGTALVAMALGALYERRAGWCAGLCPLYPVEKLYGTHAVTSVPNAHCGDCRRCALPCPDWTPGARATVPRSRPGRLADVLMVGAFPGFVWGWFLLPDRWAWAGWGSLLPLYGYPLAGAAASLALYLVARRLLVPARHAWLERICAASAVSLYYAFRLPQLFGFNPLHNNGTLVDLTGVLPPWSMALLNVATTAFFFAWLAGRGAPTRGWSVRPPMAAVR